MFNKPNIVSSRSEVLTGRVAARERLPKLAGGAMRLAYSATTWGVVGSPAGVTSVADLVYFADGDLEQALTDISALSSRWVKATLISPASFAPS
jgi:hypothetical protein